MGKADEGLVKDKRLNERLLLLDKACPDIAEKFERYASKKSEVTSLYSELAAMSDGEFAELKAFLKEKHLSRSYSDKELCGALAQACEGGEGQRARMLENFDLRIRRATTEAAGKNSRFDAKIGKAVASKVWGMISMPTVAAALTLLGGKVAGAVGEVGASVASLPVDKASLMGTLTSSSP